VRAIFIKPLQLTSKASPIEDMLYVAVLAACYSETANIGLKTTFGLHTKPSVVNLMGPFVGVDLKL
jgi:hypothetical protein